MEGAPHGAPNDPAVGDLALRRELVPDSMLCVDVDATFRSYADLNSVAVQSKAGVYLVTRAAFHESLTGPQGYGYALYGTKPLSALPPQHALTVTADTPCEWVIQQILSNGRASDDEILVEFRDGGYGTVAVAPLLDHLWHLSRGRARKLDAERRRLHALVDHASDLTLVVDRHGALTWSNISHRSQFPFTNLLDGVAADDIARTWELLTAASQPGADLVEGEFRFRFDDGAHRWFGATFRSLISDPAVRGVVVTMSDIEVERQMRQELMHGASSDSLTGLANRAAVRAHFETASAAGNHPTLLILDIDGFKVINDRFGVAAGDAVLQEIAQRLRIVANTDDTVARLDGDSFAIITNGTADELSLGERVRDSLATPVVLDDASLRLSSSIGIATKGDEAIDVPILAEHATLALTEAKARGRNNVVIFDPTMEVAALQREEMRGRLSNALVSDAFSLVFQPQMSLSSTQPLRGFEALIRWPDPARGSIPPDEFIPLAEETGEIVEIGRWVLSGALQQLGEWHRYGANLTMAVNTSVRELSEASFAPFVRAELERCRIDPSWLELEITETALATDDVAVLETLNQLRDIGVGIAIDDYGLGHASIAYLRRFPISTIKVDRALVAMLDDDSVTASALLKSITDVGKALGLRSVVEGLETAEQTAHARALGFDLGQGWHCGMPMSALRASKLVAVARRDDTTPSSHEQAPDMDASIVPQLKKLLLLS